MASTDIERRDRLHDRQSRIKAKAYRDTGRGYVAGDQAREIGPRDAARGAGRAAQGTRRATRAVTYRRPVGSKHVLTAELVAGLLIVLVRVVADYEPQSDGTVKGKILHPKGQYGPIPIAAGLIATFFLLSFMVAKGGRWATVANASGGLIVLALALKSVEEFDDVAKTFSDWGKAKKPSGSWETSGTEAGSPLTASDGGDSSSSSGDGGNNPPILNGPVYSM